MDEMTNPQSSPRSYDLRSKDKNNMDEVTNPQSSPRSKAHLGGSDTSRLDTAEKNKVSNDESNGSNTNQEFDDDTAKSMESTDKTNGDEPQQSQEYGDDTAKSMESTDKTNGDKPKQSQESGDDTMKCIESTDGEDAENTIDPNNETKSSTVTAGETKQDFCDEPENSLHPGDETDKSHISSDERDSSLISIIGQYIFTKGYIFAALVCIFAVVCLRPSPPPLQRDFNILDVFSNELDKVQSRFPSQQSELWRRSRIHLKRHLNLTNPNEPVSLILASGRGAEKTLGCLALQIATAFTTALNSSVLSIDGTSKIAQDSDQVKLDIDRELKEAFDGGTQAAIIHRFEELPPGSTLIFYRYCDHENAAYKKVFLAFTVMLQEHMEVPPNISLGMVEKMVQEYLKEKFVTSETSTMFNQIDVDKLSGLWSRISHVILPVTAEQTIEQYGCSTSV